MCKRAIHKLNTRMRHNSEVLRGILDEMLRAPDTLEQGFWAILALFWGVAYFLVALTGLLIITIMFALLIVATIFWSYYQRI